MSVNIKVTGGLNIEWGQIDPKVTGGLNESYRKHLIVSPPLFPRVLWSSSQAD